MVWYYLIDMAILTTTVTAKRQVTIPKELDRDYPLKPGMRLTWTVENNALVARRVRGIAELAGCLKPGAAGASIADEKQAVEQARIQHYARKYRNA